jgi:DnaJ homolog subfamily C member 19
MIKFILFAALIAMLYVLGKRALGSGQAMSAGDAAKLLDVARDADPETILAAHRRLIAKVHPDAGGSAELAARVNQARDTLLRNLPQ